MQTKQQHYATQTTQRNIPTHIKIYESTNDLLAT